MKKLLIFALLPLGALALSSCGGGSSSSDPSPTPTPTVTTTPTIAPPLPPPGPLPDAPFDLRGRVLAGGVGAANVVVSATGDAGSVTSFERTLTNAGGGYSFFLGAGRYTLAATRAGKTVSRVVVLAPGGQTVDNVVLNL